MTDRYAAGHGWAVLSPHLVVLVREAEPAVLDALWQLGHRDDFSVLEAVSTLSGGALDALPGFALLALGPEPRLLIRGAYSAVVDRGDTQESWMATEVSTWSEHRLDGPVHDVTLTSRTEGDSPDISLPIVSGVVMASAVQVARVDATGQEQTDARVVPAPAPDPVPTVVSPADVLADPVATPGRVAAVPPEPVVTPLLELVPEPPGDGTPDHASPDDASPDDASPDHASPDHASPDDDGRAELRSPETLADPVGQSYDALFGPTIGRRPEDAAVRPLEEAPLIDDVPAVSVPDADSEPGLQHDGMTIAQQVRKPGAVSEPVPGSALAGVGVRARLGISDGRTFSLDRPVYVGRSPEALGASIEALPQLVTVDSPLGEVSRTHVELRLEGEDVLVRDVSSNGTLLIRPGQQPERLPARRDTLLTHGSTLVLGDELSISVTIETGT